MKKTIVSILTMIMLSLCMSSCGSKAKGDSIDLTNFIVPISWKMTRQEIINRDGTPDENNDNTIHYYNRDFSGYKGEYIYGFDDNNNLQFLKFSFDQEDDANSYFSYLRNLYGDGKTWNYGEFWYGTVNGEEATLVSVFKANIVEVDKGHDL